MKQIIIKNSHLEQHAEHHFSLGIELAHRVRNVFAEVGSFAEEVESDRAQGRSDEKIDWLSAGVKALAKLQNSGHVDDGSELKIRKLSGQLNASLQKHEVKFCCLLYQTPHFNEFIPNQFIFCSPYVHISLQNITFSTKQEL